MSREAYTKKLEESAISEECAQAAGLRYVVDASTVHADFYSLPALVIPYPNSTFSRVRYLGDIPEVDGRPIKYQQPKRSGTHIYVPPGAPENADYICVVEGELKALSVVSNLGVPCLGLGGVSMWRQPIEGESRSYELHSVLAERAPEQQFVVLFDSDPASSPAFETVHAELIHLCMALSQAGGSAFVADVAYLVSRALADGMQDPDDRIAIDDVITALLRSGVTQSMLRRTFQRSVLRNAIPVEEMPDPVVRINNEVLFDRQAMSLFHSYSGKHVNKQACQDAFAHLRIGESAKAFNVWLASPWKRSVRAVIYDPHQDAGFVDGYYNLFTPPPIVAEHHTVELWLELLNSLCGGNVKLAQWLESWLASTVQLKGKMHSAVYLAGAQGVGKTTLHETLRRILLDPGLAAKYSMRTGVYHHPNYSKLSATSIATRFNSHYVRSLLVCCDEALFAKNQRQIVENLKTLITEDTQVIEAKYVDPVTSRFYGNLIFTGNDPTGLRFFQLDGDRRWFVADAKGDLDRSWFSRYYQWLDSGGLASVYGRLVGRDLSEFDHRAPPRTVLKEELSEFGLNQFEAWFNGTFGLHGELLDDVHYGANGHPPELWRVEDLLRYAKQCNVDGVQRTQVLQVLRNRPWVRRVATKARHTVYPGETGVRHDVYTLRTNGTWSTRRSSATVARAWAETHLAMELREEG